jgi:MEMO1 family protein
MENSNNLIGKRPPAVAGYFYPASADELRTMISRFMQQADRGDRVPKAIIAPHAGYIYSGQTAARAYACLQPIKHKIKRIILLGPAHRVHVNGLALSSAKYFTTPLGDIEIDQAAINLIQDLPQVCVSDIAHEQEHSLEVHLPLLQYLLDTFTLLPLVVGEANPESVAEVLDILWGGEETFIIISSDLSHYQEYNKAHSVDTSTTRAIEQLQLEKIGPHQACGCMPMRGLLHIARTKKLTVKTIELCNSGDTAGTRDRVVGYGAYGFYESGNAG